MVGGIRFQPRDAELLGLIGELGILDFETICSRFFQASEAACRNKLRQYKNVGLILEYDVEVKGLKRPVRVYRVSPEGADELDALTGSRPKRTGGIDPPSGKILQHRLGMIHTRLTLDDACRAYSLPPLEWIGEWDTLLDAPPRAPLDERIVLCHSFDVPCGQVRCWPDAAGRFPETSNCDSSFLAYFEYDRSTVELAEITKRLTAYSLFFSRELYRLHWPRLASRHVARVLFVCKSSQRVSNLIDAARRHPAAAMLLFATAESLTPETVLSERVWQRIDGELVSILPASRRPVSQSLRPASQSAAEDDQTF